MSLSLFFSCSEENIMLYHPEEGNEPSDPPQKVWLLEYIDYPSLNDLGMIVRNDISFSYADEDWTLKLIEEVGNNVIKVDYKAGEVIYSMTRNMGLYTYYDSLLVRINNDKFAESALHRTYRESAQQENASKIQMQNDSSHFTYDDMGYLKRLERYNVSGDQIPTYWEEFTVIGGNIVGIKTSANFRYIYTYDNSEHSIPAGFCYEMPLNTVSISKGGCWLLTNLTFLSEYLGKRSKNNVIRTVIMQDTQDGDSVRYGDITYEYSSDENEQVASVKMLGVINSLDIPENYITVFSYLEKEIESVEK
ncbi:MAG: hypothetical protein ACK5KT_17595 [Dysgonomonas sp.]